MAQKNRIMNYCDINRIPDEVELLLEEKDIITVVVCNNVAVFEDVSVEFVAEDEKINVFLTSKFSKVKKVYLRWKGECSSNVKVLGDALERAYGNLEWQGLDEKRPMPWYALVNNGDKTACYGVAVRPNSFCTWHIGGEGVLLLIDVCNGSHGVNLLGRRMNACSVVCRYYTATSAFDAGVAFCKEMCKDGVFPKEKVYGYNNWYYAYGKSSQKELIEDADYVAELTEGLTPRPYFVIDDCWQKNSEFGPWDCLAETFFDMKDLAEDIEKRGLKPGIWIRPLAYKNMNFPKDWLLHEYADNNTCVLDVTVPEAKEYVLQNFQRIKSWGYKLVKHDYSTYDIFDRHYFFTQTDDIAIGDWSFFDKTKTNAEIIKDFYKSIKTVLEETVVIGCNTVSHLAAGIFEMQRTGDDTSGRNWEVTRKMGFNTLAFRMMQHNIFYAVDADCVGITKEVPWQFNRQWLEVLSKSGTPLFISTKKGVASFEQIKEIKEAFRVNSNQENICIPIDWQETSIPQEWLIDGVKIKFNLF